MNQDKRLIAIFLPSLEGGGAERAMLTLANAISDSGYSVDVVLANAKGPYLNSVSAGIKVYNLQANRVLASLPALINYLRGRQPYVVLSALHYANVAVIMARYMARWPGKVVISERAHFSSSVNRLGMLKGIVLKTLMRIAYPRADGIIAVSQGVATNLAAVLRLPEERIRVVHNPVVSQAIEDASFETADHPWFSAEQSPVVLGAGRLTRQKDFATLIRAFAILRSKKDVKLLILGEGECRQQLQQLINNLGLRDDVKMPGFVSNPYSYMRHSQLFVLSSAWEGLPNVLIQAMMCGTPIVSTDCPSGPAEILEGGRWGRLVQVGNEKMLAKAMEEALDEGSKEGQISRAMDFSIENAVSGYIRIALGQEESEVLL